METFEEINTILKTTNTAIQELLARIQQQPSIYHDDFFTMKLSAITEHVEKVKAIYSIKKVAYKTKTSERFVEKSLNIDEGYGKLMLEWADDPYVNLNMYKLVDDDTLRALSFEPTNRGDLDVMWAEISDYKNNMRSRSFIDNFNNKGEKFSIDNDEIIEDLKGYWSDNNYKVQGFADNAWLEVAKNIVARFSDDQDCVHIFETSFKVKDKLYRIPEMPDLQDYDDGDHLYITHMHIENEYEKMIEFFGTMFGWYNI